MRTQKKTNVNISEKTIKIIVHIIAGLLIITFLYGFFQLALVLPFRQVVDSCEQRGWDGSLYEYKYKTLFGEESSKVYCNKNDETEAMIDLIDGTYFFTTHRSLAERFSDTNKWQEGD